MKHYKQYLQSFALSLLLGSIAGATTLATAPRAYAWVGSSTPKLHVSGNRLVDPNGRSVKLHGYYMATDPYFGGNGKYFNNNTEYDAALRYFNAITDALTDTSPKYGFDHGWYCNYVRFDPDPFWFGDYANGTFSQAKLEAFTTKVLLPFIQHCAQRGVYIVIMPNLNKVDNTTTPELQAALKTVWGYWAATPGIANADNVSFELMNEPVNARATDGRWGNDQLKYHTAYVNWIQPVVDVIRGKGAANIIWVPGLGWQSQYAGFVNQPINGGTAGNIGYAAHFYPGYIGGDHNVVGSINDKWNQLYKPCADKYPMLITEMRWMRFLTGDDPYWDLFNGVTGDDGYGFGTAARRLMDSDVVGYILGLDNDYFGTGPTTNNGDPEGPLGFQPVRDDATLAAFHWYYDYRGTGATEATVSAYSRIEAARYDSLSGSIHTEVARDGAQDLGYIAPGDSAVFKNLDFGTGAGAGRFIARIAGYGGRIQARLDSPTGRLLGDFAIPATGDWQKWQTVAFDIGTVTGVQNVCLVFEPSLNLRWFTFAPADTGTRLTVPNNGFEAPDLGPNNFLYGASGASWAFNGAAGLAANNSGFTDNNPDAPEGDQVAFLQSGGSMTQTISGLDTPGIWTIRFWAAARKLRNGFGQSVAVYIDDNLAGLASPYNLGYDLFQITAPVAPGSHVLRLQGTSPDDDTTFIDGIEVRAQSNPAVVAPGRYRITPRNSVSVGLDLAGASLNPGTRVQIGDYAAAPTQRWDVAPLIDGNYRVTPAGVPTQSLGIVGFDVNPNAVEIATSTSTGPVQTHGAFWKPNLAQEWQFTPTDSGYYRLTPANNMQMCLDLAYAKNTPGTPLDTYFYFNGTHQQWRFSSQSDVSQQVTIKRGGFSYNRTTKRFTQSLQLTNTGGIAIAGPIYIALDDLGANAILANRTGITQAQLPAGSPYIRVTNAALAPGASVNVTLQFDNPTQQGILYTTRVLFGQGPF